MPVPGQVMRAIENQKPTRSSKEAQACFSPRRGSPVFTFEGTAGPLRASRSLGHAMGTPVLSASLGEEQSEGPGLADPGIRQELGRAEQPSWRALRMEGLGPNIFLIKLRAGAVPSAREAGLRTGCRSSPLHLVRSVSSLGRPRCFSGTCQPLTSKASSPLIASGSKQGSVEVFLASLQTLGPAPQHLA